MSGEYTAFIIPEGLKLESTDQGLVIENEHDVIIRGSLGSNIHRIYSKYGDIVVDIDLHIREVTADNGSIRLLGKTQAYSVTGRSIESQQSLEAQILKTTGGRLKVLGNLKAEVINTQGDLQIGGILNATQVEVQGNARFGGDIQCTKITATQNIKFQGFTKITEILCEGEHLQAEQPLNAERIIADDALVELAKDSSIELLRANQVDLQGGNNEIKAIQAHDSLQIAEGEIRSDVVLAQKVLINPKTTGKIMVTETQEPLGPHLIKGCLQLEDLGALIPDTTAFLTERGLIIDDKKTSKPAKKKKSNKKPKPKAKAAAQETTKQDTSEAPTAAENAPPDNEASGFVPFKSQLSFDPSEEAIDTEAVAESPDEPTEQPNDAVHVLEEETIIPETDSGQEEINLEKSEEGSELLDEADEEALAAALIDDEEVLQADESIADTPQADEDILMDEDELAMEADEDYESTTPEKAVIVLHSVAAPAQDEVSGDEAEVETPDPGPLQINLEETSIDEMQFSESASEPDDSKVIDDPLYNDLLKEIDNIVDSYDEEQPDALIDLKDLVESRDYQNLCEEIKTIWSRLLKFHQRNNTRIPPKVIFAFNQINFRLRKK